MTRVQSKIETKTLSLTEQQPFYKPLAVIASIQLKYTVKTLPVSDNKLMKSFGDFEENIFSFGGD